MATDSPGSSVDLPASDAVGATPSKPVAKPSIPPAKKASPSNGVNSNVNPAGDKAAGKPTGKAETEGKQAAGKTTKEVAAKEVAPGKDAKQASRSARQRSSTREEMEELAKVGALGMMTLVPAWMISAVVHMMILIILGILLMPEKKKDDLKSLIANVGEKVEGVDEVADITEQLDTEVSTDLATTVDVAATNDIITPTEIDDSPAPAQIAMSDVGIPTAPAGDLLRDLSAGTGGTGKGSLSGRGGNDAVKRAVGATDASEAAVARALKWLADHQYADGSWSFEHTGVGRCTCTDNGKLRDARFAATGMALLPFLGAGQTHKQGKYKEQVRGGLYWLVSNMAVSPNGGDMTGGGGAMYGHGIASIALCEAYAMTQDKQLGPHAQAALNYIMYAQDPVGGGWRYGPRQAGDTSVVGWQVMALKSGYLGSLQVSKPTVTGAIKFLDSAGAEGGAYYGYDRPGQGLATTAVGLLCRMYLGWEHEKPELEKGVKYLAGQGPTTSNMYYSYYATQVLHQFDGPDGDLWQSWNTKMRDALVASQSMEKHETGSWTFKADVGYEPGGRLYCTSMAAMTLEIYYRYMPIYTKKSAEDDFMD
ncbi:MAG TPA: hypothetical protein VG826_27540 [Pirellulales bacterium]|nr:hypothetical protein [Pirellulales bacterium]